MLRERLLEVHDLGAGELLAADVALPAVDQDGPFKVGGDSIELSFAPLIPHLGEPVAVQRKVEYTLAPGLGWSLHCYLDLEAIHRLEA